MKALVTVLGASAPVLVLVVACGNEESPRCSGFPDDPAFDGADAWVPSTTDPKCCAPVHNQFIPPDDAAADAQTCAVIDGLFPDDGGVGEAFPIGTRVNLTYCNSFYEGRPQDCSCLANSDAGPTWACGI